MNYLKLKQKIYEAIERNPFDRSAYEEMFVLQVLTLLLWHSLSSNYLVLLWVQQ